MSSQSEPHANRVMSVSIVDVPSCVLWGVADETMHMVLLVMQQQADECLPLIAAVSHCWGRLPATSCQLLLFWSK